MSDDNPTNQISRLLRIPTRIRGKNHTETLVNLTQNVEFFKKICTEHNSLEIHKECCSVMTLEEYEDKDIIINFGEKADKFYIILKGSVSVLVPIKKKLKLTVQKYKEYENLYDKDSSHSFSSSSSLSSSSSSINSIQEIKNSGIKNRHQQVTKINLKELMEKMKEEEDFERQKKVSTSAVLETEEKLISQLFKDKLKNEKKLIMQVIKEYNKEFVEVEVDDMDVVGVLKEGNDFGELALISDRPRAATVVAREHVSLLVLRKDQFKAILGSITEKKISQKIKNLKNFPYFSTWSKISLSKLAYFFTLQTFTHKQVLFTQGQKINGIYFILQGEFVLSKSIEISTNNALPYVFHSDLDKQINQKIKLKKTFKRLKVVIKGNFESVGGYEIFKNLAMREYSCHCISTQGEVYFVSKDTFVTKFPNMDGIKSKIFEENQRLDERYYQLYEFERSPAVNDILKNKQGKGSEGKGGDNEVISSRSSNAIAYKSGKLMKIANNGIDTSLKFTASAHRRTGAFRKLTDTEVFEAVNGRSTSFNARRNKTPITFVRKRTPPRNFLGKHRIFYNNKN